MFQRSKYSFGEIPKVPSFTEIEEDLSSLTISLSDLGCAEKKDTFVRGSEPSRKEVVSRSIRLACQREKLFSSHQELEEKASSFKNAKICLSEKLVSIRKKIDSTPSSHNTCY